MCPLKNCRPFGKGKLLSARETARLAMLGKIDREAAVQALVKRYFG